MIEPLYTFSETAKKLGVCTRTLGRYVKRRIIDVEKIGRGKFTESAINEFIEKRKRRAVI